MGFSSSLQGDSAHEALITRQDAELRLLENMKRCIVYLSWSIFNQYHVQVHHTEGEM